MTSLTTFDIPFMESLPNDIFIDDYNNASVWTVVQKDPSSTRLRITQSMLEFILRLSDDATTNAHRAIPIDTPSFGWKYSVQLNVSGLPHTNQFNNFSNLALLNNGLVANQRTFGPYVTSVTNFRYNVGWLSYFHDGDNGYEELNYGLEINSDFLYVLEHPTAITFKHSVLNDSGTVLATASGNLSTPNPKFTTFTNYNYAAEAGSPTEFSATSKYIRLEH